MPCWAKKACSRTCGDLWGPVGFEFLNQTRLGDAYEIRLESLRDLIEVYDREIAELDGWIHRRLRDDAGYRVIQQLNGVGRVHAAVFVAEIGDVTRFTHPRQLCSWAGLTTAACGPNGLGAIATG